MAAWFIVACITLLSIVYLILQIRRKSISRSFNLPPGSYGWPLVGETLELLGASSDGTPERFVNERVEKYQSQVFKTSLMGEHMAVLCGPAGNKFLFSNENKLVTVWWPSSVRQLLGPCLATTPGEEGKQMRKLVAQFLNADTFTRFYIKTIDSVCQQHIKTYWQGKDKVRVSPIVKLFTFELSCRLFMSVEDPGQISKIAALFDTFMAGVISLSVNLPGTIFYKAKKAAAAIRHLLQKIVSERRVALEQVQDRVAAPQDLLTHLLVSPDENGHFMSESVIINNILLLLFAGHDTSSATLTMLMKYLAEFPEVFENVLGEQNEVSRSKAAGEFLHWEDIQKMKYSWNVVCESIRLSPAVVGSFREALTDISYAGYHIPKGWKLYWSAASTLKDPNFFEDCNTFNPSRYEGSGPAPFSFVPFGGGPRMCLGKELARLEILIFLHNIIKRFKWKMEIPDEKITYEPMPHPVEGLPILLSSH